MSRHTPDAVFLVEITYQRDGSICGVVKWLDERQMQPLRNAQELTNLLLAAGDPDAKCGMNLWRKPEAPCGNLCGVCEA